MSDSPTPDVAVRTAIAGDEAAIGRIQIDSWVGALGERLGRRRHDAFDNEAIIQGWADSITHPPTPGHVVFVATCDGVVVGFAAVAPPNQIVAFEIDPERRRRGHGSRLLAAAADHLKAHGSTEMKLWSLSNDKVRAGFLRDAGFGEAGMTRALDGPGIEINERLWHASLEA
jgi:GNAT superfamily N-acetyltransferase